MDYKNFIKECKYLVIYEAKNRGYEPVNPEEIFVVWCCKILQNNKALLATDNPKDDAYYEITYNGDKKEFYVDTYRKTANVVIAEE